MNNVTGYVSSPQAMAVATLVACYNNRTVFSGVVKIRRGQAVDLMMRSTNQENLKRIIYDYIGQVCYGQTNQQVPLVACCCKAFQVSFL